VQYQVVYDASHEGYAWWWLAIPLFMILIALGGLRSRKTANLPNAEMADGCVVLFGFFFIMFALCAGIIGFLFSYNSYYAAQQTMQQGRAAVVEGTVEDFISQPPFDRKVESFTVHGVHFEYAAASAGVGFHNTSTHGGPINRNGIQVRIHYFVDPASHQNVILKLEVAR
jgi:hypothetical protein